MTARSGRSARKFAALHHWARTLTRRALLCWRQAPEFRNAAVHFAAAREGSGHTPRCEGASPHKQSWPPGVPPRPQRESHWQAGEHENGDAAAVTDQLPSAWHRDGCSALGETFSADASVDASERALGELLFLRRVLRSWLRACGTLAHWRQAALVLAARRRRGSLAATVGVWHGGAARSACQATLRVRACVFRRWALRGRVLAAWLSYVVVQTEAWMLADQLQARLRELRLHPAVSHWNLWAGRHRRVRARWQGALAISARKLAAHAVRSWATHVLRRRAKKRRQASALGLYGVHARELAVHRLSEACVERGAGRTRAAVGHWRSPGVHLALPFFAAWRTASYVARVAAPHAPTAVCVPRATGAQSHSTLPQVSAYDRSHVGRPMTSCLQSGQVEANTDGLLGKPAARRSADTNSFLARLGRELRPD